jgi:site-specific DNA recombinase
VIGAVIYVRVSTKEQTENLSLPTQLKACEEYCNRHGFAVVERFIEQGESAKTADRTELKKLLTFCRTHRARVSFVVVYNLTRFAREKHDHFTLRAYLHGLGISLRSTTEPIDDTSTGKLMEGVLASFAQYDNDLKSERTKAGMKAAIERGRWTFVAPLGYLNSPKYAGASLVPDPERAPLVRQAFIDFAAGRFTKEEIRARLTAAGLRNRAGRPVQPQTVVNMLRNPAYVARIEVRNGLVARGDFEPLVDDATFYRVQAILDGRVAVTGPRPRNHPDFPLRGFLRCGSCNRPLTGSWSKGRTGGYYGYYHCQPKCRDVNVSKASLEGQFVDVLAELQPSPGFMRLVKEHVLAAWRALQGEARSTAAAAERQTKTIQQRLDCLDDAFLFAQAIDQETYTRQRNKLREELALARIDQHGAALEELDVEGILGFAEQVLPNAAQLWAQASLDHRQRLQQVFFPEGITMTGNQLNRTAVTAPWFSRLAAVEGVNSRMVGAGGIEPPTPRV